MTARLERILTKLAQQDAPELLGQPQNPDPTARLQWMARRLAGYGITVLVGELPDDPQSMREVHVNDWVRGYGQMYYLLASGLFPALHRVSAHYADDRNPPVIVLRGEASPVMAALAGFVVPYLAVRQPDQSMVSDLELRGLMDEILTDLEAGNLPRMAYAQMRENGVEILRQMLRSTIRHVSLTRFDKPILNAIQPQMPQEPVPPAPESIPTPQPPRPAELPEEKRYKTGRLRLPEDKTGEVAAAEPEGKISAAADPSTNAGDTEAFKFQLERLPEDDYPPTPTEQMFVTGIPLTRPGKRLPPVPRLPLSDDDSQDDE